MMLMCMQGFYTYQIRLHYQKSTDNYNINRHKINLCDNFTHMGI